MARGNAVAVAIAAVILGIMTVALTFGAYAKRIKVEDVSISLDGKSCTYPSSSSPAFALGLVAALCLLIEQIVISVGTGCYCCRQNRCPKNCAGIISIIIFICSWLAFGLAFLALIGTSLLNNSGYLANSKPGTVKNANHATRNFCNLGRDDLFIGSAIWCIISIVLGLISFILLKASDKCRRNRNHQRGGGNFANEEGVAMGEPMTTSAKGRGQY